MSPGKLLPGKFSPTKSTARKIASGKLHPPLPPRLHQFFFIQFINLNINNNFFILYFYIFLVLFSCAYFFLFLGIATWLVKRIAEKLPSRYGAAIKRQHTNITFYSSFEENCRQMASYS